MVQIHGAWKLVNTRAREPMGVMSLDGWDLRECVWGAGGEEGGVDSIAN